MAQNLFLNFVSEAMTHENERNDGKGSVINVSIPVDASKNGYGSFAVNPQQVYAAKKKDGTEVDGYVNILLGAADKTRKVSICTKKATKTREAQYGTIEMSNQEIADLVKAARAAYKAEQATEEA